MGGRVDPVTGAGEVVLVNSGGFISESNPLYTVTSGGGGGTSVVSGYGPGDEVVAERVRNTYSAGTIASGSTTIFSGGAYLDAFVADLSADATISSGGILSWAVQPSGSSAATGIVQQTSNVTNSGSLVFPNAPTAGHTILCFSYSNNDNTVSAPTGWTSLGTFTTQNNSRLVAYSYTVQSGDTGTYTGFSGSSNYNLAGFEINATSSNVILSQIGASTQNSQTISVSLPTPPTGDALRIVAIWDQDLLTPGTLSTGLTQILHQDANIGDIIVTTGLPTVTGTAVFGLQNAPPYPPGALVVDVKGTAAPAPLFQGDVYVPGSVASSAAVTHLINVSDMKLTAPTSGGFAMEIVSGTLASGRIYWTALGGQSTIS